MCDVLAVLGRCGARLSASRARGGPGLAQDVVIVTEELSRVEVCPCLIGINFGSAVAL